MEAIMENEETTVNSKKPLIWVLANKQFEVEGVVEGLHAINFFPESLVESHEPPKEFSRMSMARERYSFDRFDVAVRCIEHLMLPTDKQIPETSSSHSENKSKILPLYIKKESPCFIISVSTGESTPMIQPRDNEGINGAVVVGGCCFSYDGRANDPTSPSRLSLKGVMRNNVDSGIYNLFTERLKQSAINFFKTVYNYPANPGKILVKPNYINSAVLNVVNYTAYDTADPDAYDACISACKKTDLIPSTIETTHSVVKMCANKYNIPTLIVTPITDRFKHFKDDDRNGQNKIASFNAGVTVGALIREIKEKLFPLKFGN